MRTRPAPTDDDTPYQCLVCAIVRQVCYDYRKKGYKHTDAKLFLESPEAREFCEAWNLNLEYIRKRLGECRSQKSE